MGFKSRLGFNTLVLGLFSFSLSTTAYAKEAVIVDEYGMEAQNKFLGTSEFDTSNLLLNNPLVVQTPNFTPMQADIPIDAIVNIGKMIWDIIKEGKPVVNIRTDVANALPEGVPTWSALSEWKRPVAKNFEFTWTLLGMEVVKFNYSVVFTPGGKWDDKGAYLTNVMLVPTNVSVSWGYSLDSTVDVMRVVNVGTKENPVAALELRLNILFDSYLFHNERAAVFYMTGDGLFDQTAFY